MRTAPTLATILTAVLVSCGDSEVTGPSSPPVATRLEVVSGADQAIWSGRRSDAPFRVRAVGGGGEELPGVVVEFHVTGEGGGILSQPRAVTDGEGIAETFLMESLTGEGRVVATSGSGTAELAFEVLRAPGEIQFAEGTGELGLPGLPHPDSVVDVRVVDTFGEPLAGVEVWFAGSVTFSAFRDSTDADGWASTKIRKSGLWAGDQWIFAFILGFPEVTTRVNRPTHAAARRAILVSVDGLRGDAIARYGPPTLKRLVSEGAATTTARTVVPSLTIPAHLSLLAGVPPDRHGVFSDRIELTAEMAALDPLFRFARKLGRSAVAFMSSDGPLSGFQEALACRLAFGLDSLTLVEPSGAVIAEAAAQAVADSSLELIFLHIPDPDLAGHASGWMSPEYEAAVHRADSALARVLRSAGAPEDSVLVVVTADHGGGGDYGSHQHGSPADADVQIPLVLWGSGVAAATPLLDPTILDVAPTLLWALGMAPPGHYQGRILLEGFH